MPGNTRLFVYDFCVLLHHIHCTLASGSIKWFSLVQSVVSLISITWHIDPSQSLQKDRNVLSDGVTCIGKSPFDVFFVFCMSACVYAMRCKKYMRCTIKCSFITFILLSPKQISSWYGRSLRIKQSLLNQKTNHPTPPMICTGSGGQSSCPGCKPLVCTRRWSVSHITAYINATHTI